MYAHTGGVFQFNMLCSILCGKVGTCIAADAYPPATITWTKNQKSLFADGKGKASHTTLTLHRMLGDPARLLKQCIPRTNNKHFTLLTPLVTGKSDRMSTYIEDSSKTS